MTVAVDPPSRLLLLGASGKLGRALSRLWRGAAPEAPGFAALARRGGVPGAAVWVPGGVLPALGPVQTVVAAWGVTAGSRAALEENIRLARAALDLATEIGAERVLHFSSAAVYGAGPGARSERDAPDPRGPYGASKLRMEEAIADWHQSFAAAPRSVILRIGNVAGADSLFASLRAGQGVALDRLPEGTAPRRSYIAPPDLARVITALARHPDPAPVYNVAAPAVTGMDAIASAAGAAIHWRPAPAGALAEMRLDTARLSAVLPLGPETAQPEHLLSGARDGGLWP